MRNTSSIETEIESARSLHRVWRRLRGGLAAMLLIPFFVGCVATIDKTSLPEKEQITRDQLVIHSDFHVSKRHRLLDELAARRNDIGNLLNLPLSDEPIHVYLFEDQERYDAFLAARHPNFPDRRAFFVKTDTELKVYAYWGERIAEDLRHEITHGYLHSTIPNLQIWLDEGIAEYFETPRGTNGFNQAHVYLLANQYRRGEWKPDLKKLEMLSPSEEMDQTQYAESWLWTHFLIHTGSETRQLLEDHFEILRLTGHAENLSQTLAPIIPDPEARLIAHLRTLAEKM